MSARGCFWLVVAFGWIGNFAAAWWIASATGPLPVLWRGIATVLIGLFLGLAEGAVAVAYLKSVAREEDE